MTGWNIRRGWPIACAPSPNCARRSRPCDAPFRFCRSRCLFAGAARQLESALLVNPHDMAGMARALGQALAMPLEERRDRWGAMMKVLRASSVQLWFADFVRVLEGARSLVPLVPELPATVAGAGSGSERPLVRFERLFTKGG
ncbi:MAG: trehalose-6-phosphate synthase [Rhodoplanes sp.]